MTALVELAYLFAAVLFILGLKWLSSPATARKGNALASVGMLIAIVVTLLDQNIVNFTSIFIGMIIGGTAGAVLARTIKMTAMPQMVALLNGFGGGASVLVASAEFLRLSAEGGAGVDVGVSVQFSILVGAVTFSGSLIAFGKLQELVTGQAVTYPLQKPLNALLLLAILFVAFYLVVAGPDSSLTATFAGVFGEGLLVPLLVLIALSLVLGVLSVIPIGGADMAGGDLPAQFLFGYRGSEHRIRHRQYRPDHQWCAGGRLGIRPDDDHVQGHESIAHERVVWGIRFGNGCHRRVRRGYWRRNLPAGVGCRCGHHDGVCARRGRCSRVRVGRVPGTAHRPRTGHVAGGTRTWT